MTTEPKRGSAIMDSKEKAKYWFAIRMVEDGALEAYVDVSLNNDTYPKTDVCKMINGNDVVGVKGKSGSSVWTKIKISAIPKLWLR